MTGDLAASWPVWGTTATMVVTQPAALPEAVAAWDAEISAVDAAASRFRVDSELSTINKPARGVGAARVHGPSFHPLRALVRAARGCTGVQCGWKEVRSMRLGVKDLIATVLVALIAVPYVGFLINGDMLFIKDPRGMAAVGLALGIVAFLVLRSGDAVNRVGKTEIGLAAGSMTLGFVAFGLAETAAADVLLALFMGSILLWLVVELADHFGAFGGAGHPTRAVHQ